MKLRVQVWHGCYYDKGTAVNYLRPSSSGVTDKCGCVSHWVTLASNPADILNVWECELEHEDKEGIQ